MRRTLAPLAVTAALACSLALPSAVTARTRTIDSYCSPTGDYCTAITRQHGRVKLIVRTFSFGGRYQLCVKPPRHPRDCDSFHLDRANHGIFASKIDFARHFPHRFSGRYAVSWHQSDFRLGPRLHFRKG